MRSREPQPEGQYYVFYVGSDGQLHQATRESLRGGIPFSTAMNAFLRRKKPVWKAYEEWERIAGKWKTRFGSIAVNRVTREMIQDWVTRRAASVSPGTVNRELTLLKSFFHDAVVNGVVSTNPAQHVRKFREHNGRVRCLSEEEEKRLFANLPSRYHTFVRVALLTGLRRGELASLKWTDLDFPNRLITIHDPKEGGIKYLPMSECVAELMSAITARTDHAIRVFPFDPHNFVNRIFIPAVRRAEISDFRFHDLRHCFASRLAQHGVSLLTISRLLGHRSTRMTERYSHLSDTTLREAVNLLKPRP